MLYICQNKKQIIMKTFKVSGWYRYNDEKDFEVDLIKSNTPEEAIEIFKDLYSNRIFFSIDIKEI